MENIQKEKKYNKWILVLSIVIPLVITVLFGVKLDVELPFFLPPFYATTNAITSIVLIIAFIAIKNKKVRLHEGLMKFAIILSVVFLVLYVAYHMTSNSTSYQGEYRVVYFTILITHIILSIAVIPFVLITYVRAITNNIERHKKIARITFPLWLYVAVSGVVVFLMISPYY